MNNFIFSIPTTAYFGKGQINILGETIKAHGGSKVLLAYGGGSIKQNGIYDTILDQFGKVGLAYVELIKALEAFYATIKMPENLREAGVKEEDLDVMAEKAVENGNLGILTSLGRLKCSRSCGRHFDKGPI